MRLQEEDSDTTRKEGQGKGTDGTKIGGEMGQDVERRKTYTAAVIDGIKRNSTLYVGDCICLPNYEQWEGCSSLFTGSTTRACDRESRADHGKRKWRVNTHTHRDEQRRQGRDNSDSGEVQEPTEEDESSKGWTDNLIRNVTRVWKQDPRIQEFEAGGSQRDGEAALQGRVSGIRGFVGQLCEEGRNLRERSPAS